MMGRGLISLAALAATMLAPAAQAEEPTVEIALKVDTGHPGTEFEGWGTALAWFAHVTGGWPDAERERLADLFYGPDGLGWTIARYNIGGGNAPETPHYLRTGADVPGFWHRPEGVTGKDWWDPSDAAMWDFNADTPQRWWLDAIRARVDDPIFEAFSNSPPYFMTVSGVVSGHEDSRTNNLRPGYEGWFADYLVRVTTELEQHHGIRFRTLSPVNEPNTDYWYAKNTQEGSHWDPAAQARMIDATYAALQRYGLDTVVAAPDETSSQLFLTDWAGYSPETIAHIGQINVHSYGNEHQSAVRDIARASGIRLWMSENDTPGGYAESFTAMDSPLVFAEHVVLDLKRLEPSAWIFWQAVEKLSAVDGRKGTNWGLVKADLGSDDAGPHSIEVTPKYWVMAQFSRYIRPADRLVAVNDIDTVGSISADGGRMTLVHVNAGLVIRRLLLPFGWHHAAIVTDGNRKGQCMNGTDVPPQSVVTFVLTRDVNDLPC